DRRVAEAKPVEHAGAEVFDEHVRAIDELPEHLLAARRFQVEPDAPLVAVDRQEIAADAVDERRPPEARVVTARRRFDLDDGRAHVAKHHRAERTGENAGEIEYENAVERSHGLIKSRASSNPAVADLRRFDLWRHDVAPFEMVDSLFHLEDGGERVHDRVDAEVRFTAVTPRR